MPQTKDVLFKKLESIYSQMPETLGCVGCGKCCKVQHPHCYYVEFMYIMEGIRGWTEEEKIDLHIECIRNYLSNSLKKTCVFLDENNRCRIYDHRDYNCRAFGMIPKKIYSKRVREAKKNFPGVRLGLESQSDCCGDVRPETYIGGNKLDNLFEQIRDLDREIGITEQDLAQANNYMTFHDHFILYHYGHDLNMLQGLTSIKSTASDKEKELFLQDMRKALTGDS